MIILLSPSKTFNPLPVASDVPLTEPEFREQAAVLLAALQAKSPRQLKNTLQLSDALIELNHQRYADFDLEAQPPTAERAAWSYRGETFFGFDATTLNQEQITYANQHVRIVSGLYGLLRITDAILPYRLEMSTKLKGKWGKNLYQFWGSQLAESVVATQPSYVLACASNEYLKAIDSHLPDTVQLIIPKFLQPNPDGSLKTKMVFAKWSRGMLARWAVENQISTPEELKAFDLEGYRYDEDRSTPLEPVFISPPGLTLKGRFKTT